MNVEMQRQAPRKSVALYVVGGLLAAAGAIATPFVALWLEYYVFNPGDQAAQVAREERLLALAPWGGAVAAAILLLTSVVRDDGRALWVRFGRWVFGIRPRLPFTTAKQRVDELENRRSSESEKYEQGYRVRSDEVTAERNDMRRFPPCWSITRIDESQVGEFILYNKGWMVGNVHLNAPEDEFVFDGDPQVWPQEFGDNQRGGATGKRFYGEPTEKGLSEGVNFTVEWAWPNMDREERSVRLKPDQLSLKTANRQK